MPESNDFFKNHSVSKAKAKAYKREQDAKEFVADFKSGEPKLTKKQERDRLRRLQLELPLNVSHLYILDHPPKSRRRGKRS